MKTINDLVKESHQTAIDKHWHKTPREFGTLIALIHTEVSESYEAKNEKHFTEELSDILIRVFDICGLYTYNLENSYYKLTKFKTIEEFYSTHNLKNNKSIEKHLMDLHGELSKILEIFRDKNDIDKDKRITDGFAEICYSVISIAKELKLDIINALEEKMNKNKSREIKHGGKKI